MTAGDPMHADEMQFDDLFDESSGQEQVVEMALDNDVWVRHRAAAALCVADVVLSASVLTRTVVAAVQRAVAFLMTGAVKIVSLDQLGQQLAAQFGWRVVMRSGTTGGKHTPQQVNFSTIRHSFLICNPLPDLDVIIDLGFQRMFQVGHSSQQYLNFLASSVPEVFVGTMEMLMPLVACAAAAIATSFAELAMPLPPWRQVGSLKSHWQPSGFSDTICHAPLVSVTSFDVTEADKAALAQLSTSADGPSEAAWNLMRTGPFRAAAAVPQQLAEGSTSAAATASGSRLSAVKKGLHGSVPGRRSLRLPCKVQRETPRRFEFTPLALSRPPACSNVQAVDWVEGL